MDPIKPLPLNNVGSSKPQTSVSGHAQGFSVGKLQQQHKEREEAQVSIDRHMKKRSDSGPSTSVMHGSGGEEASTSIVHGMVHAKRSIHDEEEVDEVRDRLRYQYIRTMIHERQAAEKSAATAGMDLGDVHTGTGSGYRSKGKYSIAKQLKKLRIKKPVSYGDLSDWDINMFTGLVEPHMKAIHTGNKLSRITKMKIKSQLMDKKRKGNISREDVQTMKKLLDKF